MRNLEQIQESDADGRTPRAVALLLVALGGACVVFAGLALEGRRAAPLATKADPLAALVTARANSGEPAPKKATDLGTDEVTFPGILSDESDPTTALAAVKGGRRKGSATAGAPAEGRPIGPPPPTDRLPVVPLPAGNVLAASPVVTRPRDSLTRAATNAAETASTTDAPAPAGREGGYQLQVSSFRTEAEADKFEAELRARGHKAYVVEAQVPGRGTWYRVRIGPFPSQQAAARYRSGFEGREHVVPFIVPPKKKKK